MISTLLRAVRSLREMTPTNYSHTFDGMSLNSALIDNSVEYISFQARVRLLAQVSWYFKVDLKNGYRQIPVNPKD